MTLRESVPSPQHVFKPGDRVRHKHLDGPHALGTVVGGHPVRIQVQWDSPRGTFGSYTPEEAQENLELATDIFAGDIVTWGGWDGHALHGQVESVTNGAAAVRHGFNPGDVSVLGLDLLRPSPMTPGQLQEYLVAKAKQKTGLTKDTNPKSVFADTKAPISAIPGPVLYELGLALLEGALKYGRHNWRVEGVRASTYFDAAQRHIWRWWEGEDIDPDSGLPHLVKAMACFAVVRDAELFGKMTDDRPPRHDADWSGTLDAKSVALRKKYPEPKAPAVEKKAREG